MAADMEKALPRDVALDRRDRSRDGGRAGPPWAAAPPAARRVASPAPSMALPRSRIVFSPTGRYGPAAADYPSRARRQSSGRQPCPCRHAGRGAIRRHGCTGRIRQPGPGARNTPAIIAGWARDAAAFRAGLDDGRAGPAPMARGSGKARPVPPWPGRGLAARDVHPWRLLAGAGLQPFARGLLAGAWRWPSPPTTSARRRCRWRIVEQMRAAALLLHRRTGGACWPPAIPPAGIWRRC